MGPEEERGTAQQFFYPFLLLLSILPFSFRQVRIFLRSTFLFRRRKAARFAVSGRVRRGTQ